ncbi:hypothetical protein HUG17_9493 [Dermatophagoides farinae]|uniref:UBA domain-containing protein n=1 Tax=Dermatophagoides farinae TaxID=6954 RepID=A0A9D4SI50_DERFA|nr:hypothetical protein HUG17_9493 [Dermatophagoides farinae]
MSFGYSQKYEIRYKFDSELIAIEMYVLNEKRKAEQLQRLEARKKEFAEMMANQSSVILSSAPPTIMAGCPNTVGPRQQHQVLDESEQPAALTTGNNRRPSGGGSMLYNFVSNEILKPQPSMNNGNNTNNCDQMASSYNDSEMVSNEKCKATTTTKEMDHHPNHPIRTLVNPKEFENDDSSPFDNVELQSIDEFKELNKVFGALNFSTSSSITTTTTTTTTVPQVPRNSPIQHLHHLQPLNQTAEESNNVITHQAPSTAIPFPLNNYTSYHTNYSQMMTTGHYHQHHHNTFSYQQSPIHNMDTNTNTVMATSNNHFYHPHHYYQPATNPFSLATNNNSNNNNNHHHHNTTSFEMKRSSSEKKDFYEPNNRSLSNNMMTTATTTLSSRSKSVSDLTQLSQMPSSTTSVMTTTIGHHHPQYNHHQNANNLYMATNHDRLLYDRSKTPPSRMPNDIGGYHHHHLSNQQSVHRQTTNTLVANDPYDTLSDDQRKFVDRLCQMGFRRDRIARAVKHMDINDDKKIFEYLLVLQQLEDQGYDCYEAEIALHFNNYDKTKAENFLEILKQMLDFGFDRQKSIKALFKTNNDREKAIELLLKMH